MCILFVIRQIFIRFFFSFFRERERAGIGGESKVDDFDGELGPVEGSSDGGWPGRHVKGQSDRGRRPDEDERVVRGPGNIAD